VGLAPYGSCPNCFFVYPEPGPNGDFCSDACRTQASTGLREQRTRRTLELGEVPAGD